MKYMTVVAQTTPDGTVTATMTVHDEYQKAVSAYHTELAYGAISDKLASDMAVVLDSTGRVYDTCVVQGLAKPVEAEATTETTAATEASVTTESGTATAASGTASDSADGAAAGE